jgi:putative transposase
MSRPLRDLYKGAIYHITSRGNRRARIFVDDTDRHIWYHIFTETAARCNLQVYALCLMPNHYHFLVETPDANISNAMHYLNGKYAQKFNWRHSLTGHLLQGRYEAENINRQEHLLELLRYVVLNPVRAALVGHPDEWGWSTHSHISGKSEPPAWLNTAWVIAQFPGATKTECINAYRKFVDAKIPTETRVSASKPDAPDRITQPFAIPTLAQFAQIHEDRYVAVAAAWACGAYSRDQIARHFGISTRTVSRITSASIK